MWRLWKCFCRGGVSKMPRNNSGATAREAYYDRNPLTIALSSQVAATVPHSATVRETYTVPAGRKAYLESVQCSIVRRTAATAAGRPMAYCALIPSGQGSSTPLQAFLDLSQNVAADRQDLTLSSSMQLGAGDRIDLATLDDSTGGTVAYFLAAKLTEFDA